MAASPRLWPGTVAGALTGRLAAVLDAAGHSYGSSLAILAVFYVIGDAVDRDWVILITWPLGYALLAIILSTCDGPRFLHGVNLAVAAVTYPLGIAGLLTGTDALAVPGTEVFVLYAVGGLFLVLRDVLRRDTVTVDVILGAITAYVLLGVAFALVYNVAANIDADAFSPAQDPGNAMFYFSFVTLATVGYGDIAPAAGWLRPITVLEGLAGQIFLVVLVARLVGLEIAQRSR